MANEVYLITHDNLSNIVSARAASRVLEKALKAKGHSIKTISKEQMHDVLVGPVFKELQLILPSDGVKRTIQHITRLLAEQPQHIFHDKPEAESLEEIPERAEAEVKLSEPSLELESEEQKEETEAVTSQLPEQGDLDNDLSHREHLQQQQNRIKQDFSLEEIEESLLDFAQLEHIQTVLSVNASNGEVLSSRGSGFDLSSLSRLANMSLKLLGARGTVRSFHLEHKRHHLFLVPLGQFLMIIVGANQLNVGEVFSKVSTLREVT